MQKKPPLSIKSLLQSKVIEKGKSWGAGRPRGWDHSKEIVGSLFYVKGDECSLSRVRFQSQQVVFLEFRLAPPSHGAEGFLSIFGPHWNCHGKGKSDFYYVNDRGM